MSRESQVPNPRYPNKNVGGKGLKAHEPETVDEREVSLFKNGANQALRIPKEFELPGDRALLRKEGDCLILSPIRYQRLADLLDSWEPLAPEDDFPEISDLPTRPIHL